jgi:AcrR family transcriptional regulator
MHVPRHGSLHERILDAAEAVELRKGIASLTLDAAAARAGVSKGGLLHHSPTKARLAEGLVTRCAEHWRRGVMDAYEHTPPGTGRMTRALLGRLGDACTWTEKCRER